MADPAPRGYHGFACPECFSDNPNSQECTYYYETITFCRFKQIPKYSLLDMVTYCLWFANINMVRHHHRCHLDYTGKPLEKMVEN